MTFAASLSGPAHAVVNTPYTAYVQTTGSTSASKEVFHFDDGPGSDLTFNPPTTNPQPGSHIYVSADSIGKAVNADVTPSGGAQFNIPITLNSNFGGVSTGDHTGKTVTLPANAASGNGAAVEVDVDGNIYVASSHTTTGGVKDFAVTKFTPNGVVDTTFGSGGTATVDFGSDDVASAIELVQDQGLYVVGTTGTATKSWAVCKLTLGGVLDTGFNGTGKKTGFQLGNLNAISVNNALLGSEELALAGVNSAGQMTVYLIDALGTTLWAKSVIFNSSLYAWQEGFDVIVQESDQKVVVGGWACRFGSAAPGTDFALARFNFVDGSLDDGSPSDADPTDHFGTGGKVTTNFGCLISGACHAPSYDTAYSLVESRDNNNHSIYAIGKTDYAGSDQFAVVSFLESDGSRDPNFHKTGLPAGMTTGPAGIAYDADIQSDPNAAGFEMITAGGGAGSVGSTVSDFVLARFQTVESGQTTGGALDPNFGAAGVATTDFNKSNSYSTGFDLCRGIDFAHHSGGIDTTHFFNIIAAGYSGATSAGGNLALAEYLDKNSIHVNASGGAAPALAPASAPADGPSSSEADGPTATSLLDDANGSNDDLLAGP